MKEKYQARIDWLRAAIEELKQVTTITVMERIELEDKIYSYEWELAAKEAYMVNLLRDEAMSMGITAELVKEYEESHEDIYEQLKKINFTDKLWKSQKIGIMNRYNQDDYASDMQKYHDFKEAKRLIAAQE